jgi:hypothetical protein
LDKRDEKARRISSHPNLKEEFVNGFFFGFTFAQDVLPTRMRTRLFLEKTMSYHLVIEFSHRGKFLFK